MVWVKRTILLLFALSVGALLHYTLPDRDIMHIIGADNRLENIGDGWFYTGGDAATTGSTEKDIRFIRGFLVNGKPMEYRNEDTGWAWPPYLKFDSDTLQTEALGYVSSKDDPQWVIVRHYGWRSNFLSAFPNAVSITPAEGPNQMLIPWFNIAFFALIFGLCIWIYVMVRSFQELTVEPFLAEVEARVSQKSSRMRR